MKQWIVLLLFLAALAVLASGCSGGELTVTDSWARPSTAGQNGAAYLVVNNQTGQDEILLEVNGDVAEAVEVHLSKMDENSIMSMERQESVIVPVRRTVEFKPGGLHVMLINLKNDLKTGDTFEITLIFQNAGEIILNVPVKDQP